MSVLITGALAGGFMFLLVYDLLRLIEKSKREALVGGMVAGLLLSFSGQLIQSSVVVMADAPALLWAVISAWCLVRYAHSRHNAWIAAAAFTLALSAITRWIYGTLAIPWGVFCIYHWGWRIRPRMVLIAVISGGVVILLQLAHTRQNPDSLVRHAWVENWSIRNAFERDFVNPDGTFHYELSISRYYANAVRDGYYIHAIFFPLIAGGVVRILLDRRRSLSALILLCGWFVATYGFLIGIPYQNIRFSLAFYPAVTALAGIGMVYLWKQLDRLPALGFTAQGAIVLAMLVAVSSTYRAGKIEIARIASIKNADLQAIQWADENIPEANADVYTLELWLMMQRYASRLNALQIYYETPESLAAYSAENSGRATYVLLNLWSIENQWVGKAPWTALHWLEENRDLQHIGRYGNYHLWQVNP